MRKFLREAWMVLVERQKTHKALRLLRKQEWSVEFLVALMVRASHITKQNMELTIRNKDGMVFTVNTIDRKESTEYRDDSIFNHLDDENRVRAFVNEVNKNGTEF